MAVLEVWDQAACPVPATFPQGKLQICPNCSDLALKKWQQSKHTEVLVDQRLPQLSHDHAQANRVKQPPME